MRLVLKLPPSSAWGARTETLSVLGSTNGSTYSTVVGSQGYRFDPATGNTATIALPHGDRPALPAAQRHGQHRLVGRPVQ